MARGYQPTAFILGEEPEHPGPWDLLLAEADAILEAERCSQCGNYKWICHNEDNDIESKILPETCYVAERISRKQREDTKADEGSTDGVVYNHEVFARSHTPLIEFRMPYYRDRMKEREERVDARPDMPREHPVDWVDPDDE